MILKLTFRGPNVVACTTKAEPMKIGHAISFEVQLQGAEPTLDAIRQLWNMERAFNELTCGRLHVDILEKTSHD